MTLSDFFANLAVSLPSRVLTSLGIGWISYASFNTLITNLITNIISQYNSLSIDLYQILSLAGFTDGIGILLGAFSAKGSLYAIKVLGKIE